MTENPQTPNDNTQSAPDRSLVSAAVGIELSKLEGLIECYSLTDSLPGSSRPESFDKGPWDEGHWANRKPK